MTREKREALRRSVNHKTGISQRALARKFGCDQSYISRTIKRLKINCRKRVKVPKYKDEVAIKEAKKRCRKMYEEYKTLDFVVDDEKYFGLSGFQMSGNRSFYTSDLSKTPLMWLPTVRRNLNQRLCYGSLSHQKDFRRLFLLPVGA